MTVIAINPKTGKLKSVDVVDLDVAEEFARRLLERGFRQIVIVESAPADH